MHVLGIYHSTHYCLNSRDVAVSKPVNKICNLKESQIRVDIDLEYIVGTRVASEQIKKKIYII